MEPVDIFRRKVLVLVKALNGLDLLLHKDLSLFDSIITDGVKNGRIQKFEYCTELLWKTIKRFLLVVHGIETVSPKTAVKELYSIGHVTVEEYEVLCSMIDARNMLSHVYREEYFEEVLAKLDAFSAVMNRVTVSFGKI